MQTINVIDNVLFKDGILHALGREEKETMVFLKRGDLVGKCAVYSLMIMLIFHKRINREDLFSKVNSEAPPYIKELKKQFLLRTKREYSMRSEDDHRKLHFMIKEQLDAGWPVQIGFSFPQGKEVHSVVAVGYSMFERTLRLFCLDSAFDLGCASMWNNIIDINMDYADLFKMDFNHNVTVAVHVNSILLINDKPDLPFEPEEKDSILPF